ncbi:hypothetical protein MICAH_4790005 [Microcystis aeruginosa PCC 9809]|uniref:Uncharacterized protein n=1 Tax=Microcystis aeruginosa PCC 9809 TaxID=1160285 RepID=I4I158_MICAE|nr:hypothetical protein [Microcystis aeruginosa]CCI28032.1 hypothetical protein MICAH_4790005 [Microcystis aeruginosa PCC 9809]
MENCGSFEPSHPVNPHKLSEIRESNLGLIVFLRRDFLRYTITQNSQQFESLYGNYDLSWNLESFLKLSYWLCIQSSVINANPQDLFDCSIEDLKGKLERLWGKKLGADNAREAKSDNWIFAALTDFNGRLQARDIVRFGSSRLCVIIFAYGIVKCLLGKTFRTILRKKLSV